MPRKNLTIAEKIVVPRKIREQPPNNVHNACICACVYCRQGNDIVLTSDNQVSRLIGPSDASPGVTRLSGIYCSSKHCDVLYHYDKIVLCKKIQCRRKQRA